MARDQITISCAPGDWTQLNSGDATAVTFQVLRGPVYIRFTTDTTTPTELEGILYDTGEGESNKAISDLVGLSGADNMWARPCDGSFTASVYIDHA